MSHGMCKTRRNASLLCLLLAATGSAWATAPAGHWKGIMKAGDSVVRTTATGSGEIMQMRFGEPHNCAIPAELLDAEGTTASYRFDPSSNGGAFCDTLYPGSMQVTEADGRLRVMFTRAGRTWSGDLSPAGK